MSVCSTVSQCSGWKCPRIKCHCDCQSVSDSLPSRSHPPTIWIFNFGLARAIFEWTNECLPVTVSFFSSAGLVSGNVHQRWYILFSGSASELSNTSSCEITQNVDVVLEMRGKKCKQSTSELFPVESLSVMSKVAGKKRLKNLRIR